MRRNTLPYPATVILLWVLIALLLVVRSRAAFRHPALLCEDGTVLLAHFFHHPTPAALGQVYAGYVALLPNLIAYSSIHLPLTQAPWVLTYAPLLLAALANTLFAWRRFRAILPSDSARTGICLVLTLLPIGDAFLVSNTAYSIWNLLWMLILLTYAPLSRAVWNNWLQFAFVALLITSHPLSFLVIPICIYNLATRPTRCDWLMNWGLLAVVISYLATAIVITDDQFNNPGTTLIDSFWLVIHRVISESLMGYRWRMTLHLAGDQTLVAGVGLVVLGLLLLWYARTFRRLSISHHVQIGLVCYFILSITALTVLTRSASSPSLWGPWELRYFFIQQKLFWLLLLVLGFRVLARQPVWPPRALVSLIAAGYLAVLVSVNWGQFQTSPADGRRLAQFLQTVQTAIDTPAATAREFVLTRPCFDVRLQVEPGLKRKDTR